MQRYAPVKKKVTFKKSNTFDKNKIISIPNHPESDEEMELYMNMKYKPAVEIAEEVAINTLFSEKIYVTENKQCAKTYHETNLKKFKIRQNSLNNSNIVLRRFKE